MDTNILMFFNLQFQCVLIYNFYQLYVQIYTNFDVSGVFYAEHRSFGPIFNQNQSLPSPFSRYC